MSRQNPVSGVLATSCPCFSPHSAPALGTPACDLGWLRACLLPSCLMPGGIPGGVGLPLYQPVSVPEQGRPGWTSRPALVLAGPLPHRPETAEALVVERAGTMVSDNLNPGMRGQELQRTWVGPGVGLQAQVLQAD